MEYVSWNQLVLVFWKTDVSHLTSVPPFCGNDTFLRYFRFLHVGNNQIFLWKCDESNELGEWEDKIKGGQRRRAQRLRA